MVAVEAHEQDNREPHLEVAEQSDLLLAQRIEHTHTAETNLHVEQRSGHLEGEDHEVQTESEDDPARRLARRSQHQVRDRVGHLANHRLDHRSEGKRERHAREDSNLHGDRSAEDWADQKARRHTDEHQEKRNQEGGIEGQNESANDVCGVLKAVAQERNQSGHHPTAKDHNHDPRPDELRNIGEGHFLNLGNGLERAHDETNEQSNGKDREPHHERNAQALTGDFKYGSFIHVAYPDKMVCTRSDQPSARIKTRILAGNDTTEGGIIIIPKLIKILATTRSMITKGIRM